MKMVDSDLSSSLIPGIVHFWLIDADHIFQYASPMDKLLSPEEIERSNRYRFEKDRLQYVIRRGVLRLLLSQYTGISPADLVYLINPYGKLSLPSHPIQFSASHSQNRIVFAFSMGQNVGVDIEQVVPLPELAQLAESWFSSEECAGLSSLTESDRLEGFYHVWTQKEAFIKAHGEGLTFPLRDFSVSVDPDQSGSLLAINGDDILQWKMISFKPDPGWRVAVCVRSERLPEVKQYKITLQDFYTHFIDSF